MATAAAPAEPLGGSKYSSCQECGARLAYDQRYCVECGARRGALPPATAKLIGVAAPDGTAEADRDGDSEAGEPAGGFVGGALAGLSPAAAGVAVMALLAFGVLVGSAVSPLGQGAAVSPIVVAVSPPTNASTPPPSAPATTPASAPAEASAETGLPSAAPEESVSPETIYVNSPSASTAPSSSKPFPETGGSTTPSLPPVKNVFLIVLSGQGFNAAFGASSVAPYLSKTLTHQGELVDNYYGVTGGELANEIGLVSGQGPTPQTAVNCPLYTDITPATAGAQGQILGTGCVYPQQALSLGDQLTANGQTWKAYIEGQGPGSSEPSACNHPTLGGADANQTPTAAQSAVTWRDPFLYFHTVTGNSTCASSLVGANQLPADLASATKTPALAYIVPDRCHDGSPEPCAPGAPSGLVAAEGFLRKVVPEIEASPAYKSGGLIAITFDQAPQSGPNADSSGCCLTTAYPNLPSAGVGATGPSGPAGATGEPGSGTTAGSTGATGSSGVTGANGTTTGTPAGGGQVGLLLLSKYVKPGSLNTIGQYNHFSLLASIENLFSLTHLGYAGAPGLLVFDKSVYNAKP
jgi:hypothetical protein